MTERIYEIFDLQLPSDNFTVYLNTKYKARRGRYDRSSHTWITNENNQEVNLHIPVVRYMQCLSISINGNRYAYIRYVCPSLIFFCPMLVLPITYFLLFHAPLPPHFLLHPACLLSPQFQLSHALRDKAAAFPDRK